MTAKSKPNVMKFKENRDEPMLCEDGKTVIVKDVPIYVVNGEDTIDAEIMLLLAIEQGVVKVVAR